METPPERISGAVREIISGFKGEIFRIRQLSDAINARWPGAYQRVERSTGAIVSSLTARGELERKAAKNPRFSLYREISLRKTLKVRKKTEAPKKEIERIDQSPKELAWAELRSSMNIKVEEEV